MKRLMMITTGGTIACKKNQHGGLVPALNSNELLEYVPELKEICDIDLLQLFNIDSTNMTCEHWQTIAQAIKENYRHYDGFVITHGTDTMAYTATAIAYMVQNLPIPIVFTGSQKSIANRDTDARNNLICAFRYAASDVSWGVHIVFDNKVILATRARKVRSKSFNAFQSIDYPETAVFRDGNLISYIYKQTTRPIQISTSLNPNVFVLRLIPSLRSDILDYIINRYDALVIEGFGVGGLPDHHDKELLKAVQRWTDAGKLVVFSTQVQHEGSDMSVYEVGRLAKQLDGVIEAKDMTPEAIITKLMWVLSNSTDRQNASQLFTTPVLFDLL